MSTPWVAVATLTIDGQTVTVEGLAAAICFKVLEHLDELTLLEQRKGHIELHNAPGTLRWIGLGQDEPFVYRRRPKG